MYEYYDMSIGRIVYLNGSDYNQREVIERESIPIVIGFGALFLSMLKKNRRHAKCAINTNTHNL
jgi:hypothetical protein